MHPWDVYKQIYIKIAIAYNFDPKLLISEIQQITIIFSKIDPRMPMLSQKDGMSIFDALCAHGVHKVIAQHRKILIT